MNISLDDLEREDQGNQNHLVDVASADYISCLLIRDP
jgi:hypothetical protein